MIKGLAAQQCVQVDAQGAVTCELCRINNTGRDTGDRIETDTLVMSLCVTCDQWKHWDMKTPECWRVSLRQLLLRCNYALPFKATLDVAADNEDIKWANFKQKAWGGFNILSASSLFCLNASEVGREAPVDRME